jgi:hypothetical protein
VSYHRRHLTSFAEGVGKASGTDQAVGHKDGQRSTPNAPRTTASSNVHAQHSEAMDHLSAVDDQETGVLGLNRPGPNGVWVYPWHLDRKLPTEEFVPNIQAVQKKADRLL